MITSRSSGRSAPEPRECVVDRAQRRGETGNVLAVAVDLVGLDQVGEHEACLERRGQFVRGLQCRGVRRARVGDVDPDAREEVADLADAVNRYSGPLQRQQIAVSGRGQRPVPAPLGALEARPGGR